MSELLYRLGQFSARRAWVVIASWFIILGLSVGAALSAGGTFSSAMTIDGTPAQQTIDKLQKSFPSASRGMGQVIFHKTDGTKFSAEELSLIADALIEAKSLPGVSDVVNPFTTQEMLDDKREQAATAPAEIQKARADVAKGEADLIAGQEKLDDGAEQISKGWAELNDAKAQIKSAKAELEDGQTALDEGAAQLAIAEENEPQLLAAKPHAEQVLASEIIFGDETAISQAQSALDEINAGLASIAAARAELAAGQARLDAGWAEVRASESKIESGRLALIAAEADLEAGQEKLDAGAVELADGKEKLAAAEKLLEPANQLIAATSEFRVVSVDGQTAIATVLFDKPMSEVDPAQRTAVVNALLAVQTETLAAEVSQEMLRSIDGLLGVGEVVGLVIAAVVLFVMLGTLVGSGLPVLSALMGVGISATITLALAAVVEFTSTTPLLGVMLGLAVGIDYSLFILNRHRRQLKLGMKLSDSIALANGTSGNSVTFAGLTVIIALAALNLTGIGFLGLMGTMGAMAIAISVFMAVTFTPALMAKLGMRLLNKRERKALASMDDHIEPERISTKPVFATRHPWVTVLATIALLGIIAIPTASLRLGLPDGSSEPLDSAGYKSYMLTKNAFGEGVNGSLIVVVQRETAIAESEELNFQAAAATEIMKVENVVAAVPSGFSDDRTMALFQVIPAEGPNAVSTPEVVYDVRDLNTKFESELNSTIEVTGIAAVNIDVSQKLGEALPLYLGTVLGLSLLLMILVFRSIAVPVIATVGFLLTVFATLGATVAVFQWGWFSALFDIHDPAPILSFLPTILIGILFGLAMDYQLFLASGMREAFVHGKSAKDAINHGIHLSRAVVVAAAIIMVAVFGGFIFSHTTMIRPMGFGLAAGVLVDAFVVRLMLVPAVLTLLGDKAWWLPRWLDRLLPDVDVEGAKLERSHGD